MTLSGKWVPVEGLEAVPLRSPKQSGPPRMVLADASEPELHGRVTRRRPIPPTAAFARPRRGRTMAPRPNPDHQPNALGATTRPQQARNLLPLEMGAPGDERGGGFPPTASARRPASTATFVRERCADHSPNDGDCVLAVTARSQRARRPSRITLRLVTTPASSGSESGTSCIARYDRLSVRGRPASFPQAVGAASEHL